MSISNLKNNLIKICEGKNLPTLKIIKALNYAEKAHSLQYRKSGELYISHPIEVAILVADLDGNESMIQAALLHDTIEDTDVTEEDILNLFGREVCTLVLGCTKTSSVRISGNEEEIEKERLRNLFVALSADPRVVVIKLADRLHNLRTINFLSEEKAKRIAIETLAIHSPLAHRLGLGSLKAELEDRSFEIADPDNFQKISREINQIDGLHSELIKAKDILAKHLFDLDIKAEVQGRIKHKWSVYQKSIRYQTSPDKLHDLLGLRVIVDNIIDCYQVLDSISLLWDIENERLKDYIKNPKSNGYQSIHVTANNKNKRLEIQIRTKQMHRECEYGPASHWSYKNNVYKDAPWLQRLLDWEHESETVSEYLEAVKRELRDRRDILILTPNQDVITLPEGSTVIDLAYAIHTKVGDSAVAAVVDGHNVALDRVLKNSEMVQIIKGRRNGPSLDWLNFAITSKAKSSIRKYHQKKRRIELQIKGEELLKAYSKSLGSDFSKIELYKLFYLKTQDNLLEKIAIGSITESQFKRIINKSFKEKNIIENYVEKEKPTNKQRDLAPSVLGISNSMVILALCCKPNRGDEIRAITNTGKIKVHKDSCVHIEDLTYIKPERLLDAYWISNNNRLEAVTLLTEQRFGLLAEIASRIHAIDGEIKKAEFNNNILSIIIELPKDKKNILNMSLKLVTGVKSIEFSK